MSMSNMESLRAYFEEKNLDLTVDEDMKIHCGLSVWTPNEISKGRYVYNPSLDIYDNVVNMQGIVVDLRSSKVKVSLQNEGSSTIELVPVADVMNVYYKEVDKELLVFLGYHKVDVDRFGNIIAVSNGKHGAKFIDISLVKVAQYIDNNRDERLYDLKAGVEDFAQSINSHLDVENLNIDMLTFNGAVLGFAFKSNEEDSYFLAMATKSSVKDSFNLVIKISGVETSKSKVESPVLVNKDNIRRCVSSVLKNRLEAYTERNEYLEETVEIFAPYAS